MKLLFMFARIFLHTHISISVVAFAYTHVLRVSVCISTSIYVCLRTRICIYVCKYSIYVSKHKSTGKQDIYITLQHMYVQMIQHVCVQMHSLTQYNGDIIQLHRILLQLQLVQDKIITKQVLLPCAKMCNTTITKIGNVSNNLSCKKCRAYLPANFLLLMYIFKLPLHFFSRLYS